MVISMVQWLLLVQWCIAKKKRQSSSPPLATAVDWDARIFRIDKFVSNAEADMLVEAGYNALSRQEGGDDSWKTTHAYSTVFFDPQSDYQNKRHGPLFRKLEDRIARLTMIPQHSQEGPLMFTRQIPGVLVGNIFPNQVIRNVHHDKNMRERRAVSVLVYLSGAEPHEGGQTLFPCLPVGTRNRGDTLEGQHVPPKGRFSTRSTDFYNRFQDIFKSGGRMINGKPTQNPRDDEKKKQLLEECNHQCLLANNSEVRGCVLS
jgi:hypothetical protein